MKKDTEARDSSAKASFGRHCFLFCVLIILSAAVPAQHVLRLHPKNPHYFLYKNKPLVMVGSGEHYNAVLNRGFDYTRYLRTLQQDGLNTNRLFTGANF